MKNLAKTARFKISKPKQKNSIKYERLFELHLFWIERSLEEVLHFLDLQKYLSFN